ncbi:MAG: phosphate signaling complex protein PhoU, partial [Nitrospiria bacterium]
MPKHLQNELEKLKKKLLSLSAIVEGTLEKSIRSFSERNEKLAIEVIEYDDTIDEIEVEVEEDCLKIMALHQPVAIDLRFLVAVLKINNDLERIGDLSVNIAERSLYLCRESSFTAPFDFGEMTTKTRSMLKRALDSLIHQNPELAHQVCADDDEVDSINRQIYNLFYDEIRKTPHLVEP